MPPDGAAAAARESVVGRLLASRRSDLRTAGARLVAAFAALQVPPAPGPTLPYAIQGPGSSH